MATSTLTLPNTAIPADISGSLWRQSDNVIQALLVVVQRLDGAGRKGDTEEDETPHVPTVLAQQREIAVSLRVSDIMDKASAFTETMSDELSAQGSSQSAPHCLARLLPFLEALAETFTQIVGTSSFTLKSTYKLCYVVSRVMLDLAQKGFCKPMEESESKPDGQDGDAVDGTGMGAGTGDKNVSSEIEEEGQIEGVQGEKEEGEDESGDRDAEDDAVSMDEDFSGGLDDGKEKGEQDGSEDEEEGDHDEHVGDVDPLDPGAVDEKFWGDQEKPEEGKDGKEDVTDQKARETGAEAESLATDNDTSRETQVDKQQEAPQPEQDSQPEELQHDQDIEEDGVDPTNEENEGDDQAVGQDSADVAMPEGDRLDLPENLDFGSEQNDGDKEDLDDDMAISGDEADEEKADHEVEDAELASNDDGVEIDEAPPATGVAEDDSVNPDPDEPLNDNLDMSASGDVLAQETSDMGKGMNGKSEQQDRISPQDDIDQNAEERDIGDEEELPADGYVTVHSSDQY